MLELLRSNALDGLVVDLRRLLLRLLLCIDCFIDRLRLLDIDLIIDANRANTDRMLRRFDPRPLDRSHLLPLRLPDHTVRLYAGRLLLIFEDYLLLLLQLIFYTLIVPICSRRK